MLHFFVKIHTNLCFYYFKGGPKIDNLIKVYNIFLNLFVNSLNEMKINVKKFIY